MTKKDIHQRFIDQLSSELESITAAARKTYATATSAEHRADNKYDTFKLEASFLSRGLAKRVADLTQALESLRMLPLKKLRDTSPIRLGALVRLKGGDGATRHLLFGTAAGGETIMVEGEEVTIVTSGSPLGQAVLGKVAGDTIYVKIGTGTQSLTVVSVA
jgi:transcription elongation GreA/GreB family factor